MEYDTRRHNIDVFSNDYDEIVITQYDESSNQSVIFIHKESIPLVLKELLKSYLGEL